MKFVVATGMVFVRSLDITSIGCRNDSKFKQHLSHTEIKLSSAYHRFSRKNITIITRKWFDLYNIIVYITYTYTFFFLFLFLYD